MRCVAVVTTLLLLACSPQPEAPEGEGPAPVPVEVVPAVRQTVSDEIRLAAETAPWAAVDLTAEVSGRIERIAVDLGSRVARTGEIARLDPTSAAASLERARAVLAGAEASLEQAARDLERGRILAETRDISSGELDRLELAHATALAARDEARAAVTLAEDALADTVIRAPFAGVVTHRHVDPGSWVSPGTPVVRLVDSSRLKVRGAVDPDDRWRLAPGVDAVVVAASLAGAELRGKVRAVGEEADAATGTFPVEVVVQDPTTADGRTLRPGTRVELILALEQRQATVIPLAAVLEPNRVFVVEDDVAEARQIEPGLRSGEVLEVVSGLDPGEAVVVRGQHVLGDGDPVEVVSP